MTSDADTCWKAVRSRDRRFEGRFVVAVRTTGVYCRPGCPAPIPKRENVRFYACAAAAEDAGFRPCLRCRPDSSPESAAWHGTSSTVTRALRIIASGGCDTGGVDALAERLGLGARHLRRLFAEQLGTSPLRVAHTRKVHFARKLLDETSLPVAEVAHGAGFSSIRRFNQAMRDTFHRTPTELRKGRRRESDAHELELTLPFKPPLDWEALTGFLSARAIAGVEHLDDAGVYRRTVAIDGATGTIEVRPPEASASTLVLQARLPMGPALQRVLVRVRRMLDLECDPSQIAADLVADARLRPLVGKRPGLRVPGAFDGFETAVRAVLGQQITVKGATTLSARLVAAFGTPLATGVPGLTHLFPTPAVLAEADLASIGLTSARATALRELSRAVASGTLQLDGTADVATTEAALLALPGIGAWTASYVCMRALAEPDAFPAGDLGLRKALVPGRLSTEREVRARAEAWRPWRAYAALHLWNDLGGGG
jgi:AraC family transcriptional regulator, regulatory protein of adaptative response / DNA-3-methyladenine glycosylase II